MTCHCTSTAQNKSARLTWRKIDEKRLYLPQILNDLERCFPLRRTLFPTEEVRFFSSSIETTNSSAIPWSSSEVTYRICPERLDR